MNAAPCELPVHIPETMVFLREPIQFNGVGGQLVQVPHGGVSVPVPVAEAAIAKGIGFPPDSAEAVAIMREVQEPKPPDYAQNQTFAVADAKGVPAKGASRGY